MKLYDIKYPRLEARRRDDVKRELVSSGWDVWTDFCFEFGPRNSVLFDLLARKEGMVRVVEFVRGGHGKKASSKIDRYRQIAEANGWEFIVEEVRDPTNNQSFSNYLSELQTNLDALVLANSRQTDPVIKGAISTQAALLASTIVSELLQRTFRKGASEDAIEAARRLVDKNKMSNEMFERIVRLQNLRNKLVHGVSAPLSDAVLKDATGLVDELRKLTTD